LTAASVATNSNRNNSKSSVINNDGVALEHINEHINGNIVAVNVWRDNNNNQASASNARIARRAAKHHK